MVRRSVRRRRPGWLSLRTCPGGQSRTSRRRRGARSSTRERIVKKWYFWVTILAIAASGAAITGIAIKAANDERKDSLDPSAGRVRLGPLDQGFGLRF